MAAAGFGTSPFVLPQMFDKPGDALQQGLVLQERRAERQADIDFRNQRIKEQDDWKKLQLIQELTDLNKYQTGEQAADAIGFQKAQELLQNYTARAASMTPAELQYNISKDIGKTTLGMQTMKDELMQSDAQIKALKQIYPSLNTESLMREHRKEILGRRVQGSEFVNPQIVEPSNFKLNDPDFLSYFVRDSKALTESIKNPKSIEEVSVAMGSPSSYTSMKGKLSPFRKLNYSQDDIKNGFLRKGVQPSMDIMAGVEKFRGQNIDVLADEPFSILDEGNRLELAREARQKFSDYDLMSQEEKRTARKNVAFDAVKSIDRSGFDFGTATKPPSIHVSTGGSSNADANLNNIYERIKQKGLQRAKDYSEGNYFDNSLLNSDLDADELEVVLKGTQNKDLTPEDVKVIVEDTGRIGVYDKGNGKRLVYLNQTGTNLPKQANVAAKKVSVAKGNEPFKPVTANPNPPGKTKTYKGLDKDGNPIFE